MTMDLLCNTRRGFARAWNSLMEFRVPKEETALIGAARHGDTETVERLLREGADPNVQNIRGSTALHCAVRHGHVDIVASLLAHGANHAVADKRGHTPLSLDYTSPQTLHAIRQRYQRFRICESAEAKPQSQYVEDIVSALDRKGIVKVSGLIAADELERMQKQFEEFVRNLESKVARGVGIYQHYDEEEHWWPKDRVYVTNNAFKYSPQLVELCCRDTLLEIIDRYIGKTAFIQRGVAMRYLPSSSSEDAMFDWHHDKEEKRLKVMILLTDVTAQDQYMSYVAGSHRLFHPYKMFFGNKCSLEYCEKQLGKLEIENTLGKAGDVFLFDSNGSHRGNRRLDASTRDAFFVEYTADKSHVWGGDIDARLFREIPLRGANPFERMMAVEKQWTRRVTRKTSTWIETLPCVETWL